MTPSSNFAPSTATSNQTSETRLGTDLLRSQNPKLNTLPASSRLSPSEIESLRQELKVDVAYLMAMQAPDHATQASAKVAATDRIVIDVLPD